MKFSSVQLSTKMATLFITFVLIGVLNFVVISYFLNRQRGTAAVLNAVAKNRMYSQRIALYGQLAINGQDVEPRIEEAVNEVENSLHLIRHGGSLSVNGKEVGFGKAPAQVATALADCEEQWQMYKQQALSVSNKVRENTTTDSAQVINPNRVSAQYLADHSGEMLQRFNAITDAFVAEAEAEQSTLIIIVAIFGLVNGVLMIVGFVTLKNAFNKPLSTLTENTIELGKGQADLEIEHNRADEFGLAFDGLKRLTANIKNAASFAHQIAQGNFAHPFEPASEKDRLGHALIDMREKLQEVSIEDKKRNWVTEGLARFADILRKDQSNLSLLADNVLSALVKYCDANQGSLFVLNDDDPTKAFLELKAAYAWNKKKFVQKQIQPGEGLVGQAWIENDIIYLKEVPQNYIQITSGLGEANPRCIVILPLKLEDRALGVLELASFRDYEKHQLDFLQKFSETLASTLNAAKVNERTKRLLEQSQQQAEELRAQEEEVRQNMEELQATQEEMRRKNTETEGRLVAIDQSGIAAIEFNLDGTIVTANENFLQLMEYTLPEIVGKHHRIFVSASFAAGEEYKKFWEDLARGIPRPGQYRRQTKSGKQVVIQGSYSIIADADGKPYRILKLANDITGITQSQEALKSKNADATNRLRAIDESGIASIEFKLDGTILDANKNFLDLMGYTLEEIIGRHHRIFVEPDLATSDEYIQFWKDLQKGIPRPGTYTRRRKDGSPVVIQGSYSILRDGSGRPERILKLANDITSFTTAPERAHRSVANL